ncbi:MAG: hypothetical protein J7J67_01845 [Thermoproteales archaeon]|nr:hypothetical protein [Thermoproteales archaeon]
MAEAEVYVKIEKLVRAKFSGVQTALFGRVEEEFRLRKERLELLLIVITIGFSLNLFSSTVVSVLTAIVEGEGVSYVELGLMILGAVLSFVAAIIYWRRAIPPPKHSPCKTFSIRLSSIGGREVIAPLSSLYEENIGEEEIVEALFDALRVSLEEAADEFKLIKNGRSTIMISVEKGLVQIYVNVWLLQEILISSGEASPYDVQLSFTFCIDGKKVITLQNPMLIFSRAMEQAEILSELIMGNAIYALKKLTKQKAAKEGRV